MNPYTRFVKSYLELLETFQHSQYSSSHSAHRNVSSVNQVLIFSPHPDDECIIGALPLRLLHEDGKGVSTVAVTLGSNKLRQGERLAELKQACASLGFGLIETSTSGLEGVNPKARQEKPSLWQEMVDIITAILLKERPQIIFLPHDNDWHPTHSGTHLLVMDALAQVGDRLNCVVIETEYWHPMSNPNLLVEVTSIQLADLIQALVCHTGEVARNPYHLSLPAWMHDNVRRGSERIQGAGLSAYDIAFATLYRVQLWTEGTMQPFFHGGHVLTGDLSFCSAFKDKLKLV